VVADAGVHPGDLVLDIGAGRGALTAHLLAGGARVLAVELHPDRAAHLRERFATAALTVVEVDALDLRLPRRPFRVVANPSYAIASPLLRLLLAPGSPLAAADLVLPRAVVGRYADGVPAHARHWRRRWRIEPGRPLPRRAFQPPPRVDSGVLRIRRR
jgi:23S rRNA (adenine-N6)-dimethyltransferase